MELPIDAKPESQTLRNSSRQPPGHFPGKEKSGVAVAASVSSASPGVILPDSQYRVLGSGFDCVRNPVV